MRQVLILTLFIFFVVTPEGRAQNHKIDSLLNVLPKTEDEVHVDVLNKLAYLYSVISVQEAEKYVSEAIQRARAIQYSSGVAEAFKVYGLIYYVRSEYTLAMEYSYQALKIYETTGDKSGQSKVLNNLALILIAQKEYGRAYDFSVQSLQLKREIGDSVGVANSMLAMTDYFRNAGEYDTALYICQQTLKRFQDLGNEFGISSTYYSMGEIYLSQHKYSLASQYFHDAIKFARFSDDYMVIINANKQLGRLFLESSKYDSAYLYFQRTLRLARDKDNRTNEMQANQYLADYFTIMDQLDSALYYTTNAARIEREIFSNQKQAQITTMQMIYDMDKKEQELSFHKKIVRRQYVAIIGVTLILVLSVIFGTRVYALNKSNQQANEALIKLNQEINGMNENLEAIVHERTEEIKSQNQRLIEYAFFTAHEVRGPLARILGLIELAKIKDLSEDDKKQIMQRLEDASTELDDIIRTINRKLENAKEQ